MQSTDTQNTHKQKPRMTEISSYSGKKAHNSEVWRSIERVSVKKTKN
jgi:hypothetical protein